MLAEEVDTCQKEQESGAIYQHWRGQSRRADVQP